MDGCLSGPALPDNFADIELLRHDLEIEELVGQSLLIGDGFRS